MSNRKDEKNNKNNINSVSFENNIIVCNKKNNFYKEIKKGYIEMGEINLQIAMESEKELVGINEYEAWLCGV